MKYSYVLHDKYGVVLVADYAAKNDNKLIIGIYADDEGLHHTILSLEETHPYKEIPEVLSAMRKFLTEPR